MQALVIDRVFEGERRDFVPTAAFSIRGGSPNSNSRLPENNASGSPGRRTARENRRVKNRPISATGHSRSADESASP